MKICYLFIYLFFISTKFWLSDCFSNTITPENPIITAVLGHNSTNVEFQWIFTLERREEIKDFNVKRNVKCSGAKKERILVSYDVHRNYSKSNSSLYTFTHNYTQGSLSGYFSFTIKDITKQGDNSDGSKFKYLSDELSYLLEITYLNDQDSRKESKIQLWILSLPRISYLTRQLYAKQGDSITLRCNASGHPAPRATWIHKDTNTVIARSSVTSFNITGKASGGMYCCHVTNGLNETNCTSVSVMEYQPINTILKSSVRFSTANATFKVICKAEASPPARYYIQQEKKSLRDNSTDGNVAIVTPFNGTYIIISCFAKNKYGEGNLSTVRIPIYEPPSIVTHWDYPVTTNKTNTTFQCKATGFPSPTITWHNTADDKVVSSENGKLEVKNKECKNIILKYYCVAANDAGKAATNLTVKVICEKEENESHPSTEPKISIVVACVLVLLLLSVLLFILIKCRSKRDINKDTQQPDSRQNQLVEECPYGEPVDSGMPASGSNADYATVEETGYRRATTSNYLQEPRHGDGPSSNKAKPASRCMLKSRKKRKKDFPADIPMDFL